MSLVKAWWSWGFQGAVLMVSIEQIEEILKDGT